MLSVTIRADGWEMSGAMATGLLDRLLGRHRAGAGTAVILATRSVHGLFETEPIQLVVVDRSMRVSRVLELKPGRVVVAPEAHWIIELPLSAPPPPRYALVEVDHG